MPADGLWVSLTRVFFENDAWRDQGQQRVRTVPLRGGAAECLRWHTVSRGPRKIGGIGWGTEQNYAQNWQKVGWVRRFLIRLAATSGESRRAAPQGGVRTFLAGGWMTNQRLGVLSLPGTFLSGTGRFAARPYMMIVVECAKATTGVIDIRQQWPIGTLLMTSENPSHRWITWVGPVYPVGIQQTFSEPLTTRSSCPSSTRYRVCIARLPEGTSS